MLFPTTIAGSLPKPSWLAETERLWPQWRQSGDALAEARQRGLHRLLQDRRGLLVLRRRRQAFLQFLHAGSPQRGLLLQQLLQHRR